MSIKAKVLLALTMSMMLLTACGKDNADEVNDTLLSADSGVENYDSSDEEPTSYSSGIAGGEDTSESDVDFELSPMEDGDFGEESLPSDTNTDLSDIPTFEDESTTTSDDLFSDIPEDSTYTDFTIDEEVEEPTEEPEVDEEPVDTEEPEAEQESFTPKETPLPNTGIFDD